MKVFIDSEYKCHTEEGEGRREFLTPFFEGKCRAFIEGYRYIPEDETWEREDGTVFRGLMIAPWKDYAILSAAQEAYEEARREAEEDRENLGIITGEVDTNDES